MKRTILLLLVLGVSIALFSSVKPRKTIINVNQPDGTELTLRHVGNGHFSFFQTVDGYIVGKDNNGDYKYVESIQDDNFVLSNQNAHNPADRKNKEFESIRNYLRSEALYGERSEMDKIERPSLQVGLASTAPLTSKGSPKIPLILVQFEDLKFTSANTNDSVNILFDKFCNGTNNGKNYTGAGSYGAVRDYFIAQSDSIFQPEFVVIGPVTLPKGYAYYGKDSGSRHDININEFYSEAILLSQEIEKDWTQFDNDGDGVIDLACFIYAGEGQNAVDDDNTIWPKESASGGKINGISYGAYACSNELYNGKLDGIGTVCHELSHALGLPDLYDTRGYSFGMDYWDIMDSGSYCVDGKCPCGYSAYEKDFMGWKSLVTLEAEPQKSLELLPISEGGFGYKVINKNNSNEYYILENRQNTKWDLAVGYSGTKVGGNHHGLLVMHVDYKQSAWTSNNVNSDSDHQRFTLIPADGELLSSSYGYTMEYLESMGGDPYPGNQNVTSLEGEKAFVYNGGQMDQPITSITEHEDGRITFNFCVDEIAESIGKNEYDSKQPVIRGKNIKANSNIVIYNISGTKIAELTSGESTNLNEGIYIIHSVDFVSKVIIK